MAKLRHFNFLFFIMTMKHIKGERFRKLFDALPKAIQDKANKQFQMLKTNHRHPSLHFKKIASEENLWSVRVDANYRALGVESKSGIVWRWIGTHSEFDKLLK